MGAKFVQIFVQKKLSRSRNCLRSYYAEGDNYAFYFGSELSTYNVELKRKSTRSTQFKQLQWDTENSESQFGVSFGMTPNISTHNFNDSEYSDSEFQLVQNRYSK